MESASPCHLCVLFGYIYGAIGGVASAQHANDAIAQAFISESTFFQIALAAMRYVQWLNFFWLLPLVLWLRNKRTMRPTTMLVDACLVSLLLRSIEA
jgi:hypothetical protein